MACPQRRGRGRAAWQALIMAALVSLVLAPVDHGIDFDPVFVATVEFARQPGSVTSSPHHPNK